MLINHFRRELVMGFFKKIQLSFCWFGGRFKRVEKKVVFSSFYGRGYSDNPKAIAEALLAANTDAKLVWLVANETEAATLPEGIQPCLMDTPQMVHELSTAKVWVDNCRKYAKHKKNKQFYLQTWHGFPLKRIERDALEALGADYEQSAEKDSKQIDLLLSSSAYDTEMLRRCFWYHGTIAEYGTPRNDIFFRANPHLHRKVREIYDLPAEQKIILYAPTYRADYSTSAYALDVHRLRAMCSRRFGGDWTVLVRLHPDVTELSEELFFYDGITVLDATMYPDMQELLVASDILVTDYSSCMFDFALTGKPCFLFTSDVSDYIKDRNFYFPLQALPFPVADNNPQLLQLVEAFNPEEYFRKRKAFFSRLAFREDGQASQRCAQWILEKLG